MIRATLLRLLLLVLCCVGSASAGQRMALVIGNGAYARITPLPHAKSDTDAMVAVFKDAGFTVIEKRETDSKDLKKAFKNFALTLTGGDEVIIYFTGNAVALGGTNYLLPVDAPSSGDEPIRQSAVSLNDVLADFQEAKPHLLLALIDASRPNPFNPAVGDTGLVPITPGPGQIVMYSAAAGKIAFDSLGDDDLRLLSPFPRVLQKELLKPGIPLLSALHSAQTAVASLVQTAGRVQAPALFGEAGADFQFRATAGPTELSNRFNAEEERQIWEAVDKQRQEAAYQRLIKNFPDGPLAVRAKDRIEDLRDWELAKGKDLDPLRNYVRNHPQGLFVQSAKESLNEEELWDKAKAADDMALVKNYLGRYPTGRYREPASALLSRLQAEDAARREQTAWDSATREGTEASYERYLRNYPQGRFAATAKEKTELVIWEAASTSRELTQVRRYLEIYPAGPHAARARDLDEDIQWDEVRGCNANDPADPFQCDTLTDSFVRRYSIARHGPEALKLQEALKKTRPEREERKALADAENIGDIPSLQSFLDRFPNTTYYQRALEKLAALWKVKALPPMAFRDPFVNGAGEGPEMVSISGGSFDMGSSENDSEKPLQKVILPHPFAVGKFEVTFEEWDACIADGGCSYTPDDSVNLLVFRWSGRGKRPVMNVSWEDTRQYLKWISAKTGKKYRLLSEAEWEYAARGGTTSRYSFGDDTKDIDKHGWYVNNSQREAHPVGQLAANPFHLYDMTGNVAEWVEDCWHANRVGAPMNGHVPWVTNCIGEGRAARGGSIFDLAANLRSSARARSGFRVRSPGIGFRLARDYTEK